MQPYICKTFSFSVHSHAIKLWSLISLERKLAHDVCVCVRACVRAQNKTKQNKTKQNKTKQNKTKQNKTKQNKTKQNKTKQNKTTLICNFRIVELIIDIIHNSTVNNKQLNPLSWALCMKIKTLSLRVRQLISLSFWAY